MTDSNGPTGFNLCWSQSHRTFRMCLSSSTLDGRTSINNQFHSHFKANSLKMQSLLITRFNKFRYLLLINSRFDKFCLQIANLGLHLPILPAKIHYSRHQLLIPLNAIVIKSSRRPLLLFYHFFRTNSLQNTCRPNPQRRDLVFIISAPRRVRLKRPRHFHFFKRSQNCMVYSFLWTSLPSFSRRAMVSAESSPPPHLCISSLYF